MKGYFGIEKDIVTFVKENVLCKCCQVGNMDLYKFDSTDKCQ